MAHFEFYGETKDISVRQLEFLSSVLKDRGFKNEKVTVEAVGKAGDNFIANVKRLIVQKDGKSFKMVAKLAINNEVTRKMMNTSIVFNNEHLVYTEIFPKFRELEKKFNLPECERLIFAACYGSHMEEPNEIILLEDLCVSNFTMFDKFVSLTSESVKLVLKSLAKLHSLSYVLKHYEPATFDRFSKQLHNIWELMESMQHMKVFMQQVEDDLIVVLDDDKYKSVVKGSIVQMYFTALENNKFYKKSNCCVIQQGDPWTNNIMFRLEDNKVVECCMIDYQISYQHSPVADLHYMIFNCTDYETRSKNYYEWIDYYYTQLDECLSKFGLQVNNFYKRDQFNADLRREAKVFLGQSISMANVLMRDHHEAANMKALGEENNMEGFLNSSKLSKMESASFFRFKDRVEGLIKSFLELEYL